MKIKIESDGTSMGTKIMVDGKEPKNMVECGFSCYGGGQPYFHYTTESVYDEDSQMVKRETYFLADKYTMDMMQKQGRYIGKASINSSEVEIFSVIQLVKKVAL